MKRVCLMTLAVFALLGGTVAQVEINVPGDYVKINDAVQAAAPGSTVIIAPGIYDRGTQDFPIVLKDGVSVRGTGYARTFIDAGGTGAPALLAQNIVTSSTLLSDFTVQNGNLPASGGSGIYVDGCQVLFVRGVRFLNNTGTRGGALYLTHATIYVYECRFEGNRGQEGGAVYVESATAAPMFLRNVFSQNRATSSGGAIYTRDASGAEISSNSFKGNISDRIGGAVTINSCDADFLDNILRRNEALNGGGLALLNSQSRVERNCFEQNVAATGGGIYAMGAAAGISNNTFLFNEASLLGAAYAALSASDKFLNNTIHHNKNLTGAGAAVSITNSSTEVIQNTIAKNTSDAGLGIFNSQIPVFNNIFAFNTGAGLCEYDASADPDCQNNLFYANAGANYIDEGSIPLNTAAEINAAINAPYIPQQNIVADPMFKDADMGNLHVYVTSPVSDAGSATPPTFPYQDMDGEVRTKAYTGLLPDIGADEITFPHIKEPVIFYDVDKNDTVTSGDEVVLTFDRAMVAPTTLTEADFFLPVLGNSLGTSATAEVSLLNPRQVIIHLGTSPYLTIDGTYSDSNKTPGSPSGVDVATPPPPGGLQDNDGLPAMPLSSPGPNTTGLDVAFAIKPGTEYIAWFTGTNINAGAGGYFTETNFSIPILSSYYYGFVTMRQPCHYLGSVSAVAFDGDFGMYIFDPYNPPKLTLSYAESEIDFASGEREEDLRIFRLNRRNPDFVFFELVPDSRGQPQVVDTENNTVSVHLTYLYPPPDDGSNSPVKIPVAPPYLDVSDGIYAIFPVSPFDEVNKRVCVASDTDYVTLSTGAPDIYAFHQVLVRGFAECTTGPVVLSLRPPTPYERELFSDKSNAIYVIEAKMTDGITPVDIITTASITLNYKDHKEAVFTEDVVDVDGVKGSEPQLILTTVNPLTHTLDAVNTPSLVRDPLDNLLEEDVSPAHFFSGRAVIGAIVSDDVPFTYNFLYSDEDWQFVYYFEEFDPAVSGVGPGFLSISCTTNYTFSFWENDPDEVPVVESYLYRATYPVESDLHTQQNCPSFRLRINSQNNQIAFSYRIISSLESFASPSMWYPKTYYLYFIPPSSCVGASADGDDLQFSLDFINLDDNDATEATLYFKGVEIERIPLSSLAAETTLATYEFTGGDDGWEKGNAYPIFTPPVAGTTGSALYLGVADTNTFGFWEKDTGIGITTDTLYCAHFYVFTNCTERTETPGVRLRVSTPTYMHNSSVRVLNSGAADMSPLRIPREYAVYFYPEQEMLQGENKTITLAVDIINLTTKAQPGSGIYVDRVVLEKLTPP